MTLTILTMRIQQNEGMDLEGMPGDWLAWLGDTSFNILRIIKSLPS